VFENFETDGASSEEIFKVESTSGRWSKMLPEFDSHFIYGGLEATVP